MARPLVNTSVFSPLHTTVSVQPNTSLVPNSLLNGGVSRADLPYRSLAQYGVLSRYGEIFLSLGFFSMPFDRLDFKHKCSMPQIPSHIWVH